MTRVMFAIAIVVLAALDGVVGQVAAAPNFQCSQRYFTAHEACLKSNNREVCDRVIGDRKAACLKTGCWRTNRTNRCGYSRL
jgi:hypothetical protein